VRSRANNSAESLRLRRFRRLALQQADGFLVAHLPNIRYLTGFTGGTAVLVVTPAGGDLFVPPLYREQAGQEVTAVRLRVGRGDPLAVAAAWLRRRRLRRLAFEEQRLAVAQLGSLRNALGRRLELAGMRSPAEDLRRVKEASELARIRAAVDLAARVFEQILPLVRPGVRELDLAAEIEYRMKQGGARAPAFESIVASGPRSALPHGRAGARRLAKNEFILFDLGAILCGYHSDMTRTVYLGTPSAREKQTYRAVQGALEAARGTARAGVTAGRVDAAARRLLARRGLGRYFVHSTGHGVGLEIHEEPRLAPGVETPLEAGNVITLEPGVYVPGRGGVRIEDIVVVRRRGVETLTPVSTELLCL
jgi:Xaa-Pro aminopeptidase